MKVVKSLKRKFFRKDTAFPELDPEHVPELASLSDCSDDESVERRRKLYHTKEEEDVAVFLQISQRLSRKSLIFLLQNHARTTLGITEAEILSAVKLEGLREKKELPAVPKVKKFRFAEVTDNRVRQECIVVERMPDNPPYWWTVEEFCNIRLEAAQLVRFYRKHETEFLNSIEKLTDWNAKESEVEDVLKLMASSHPLTRGLENQMSPAIRQQRHNTVRAVLDEQKKCKGMRYEDACERIREASTRESWGQVAYSARLGLFDHLEALHALNSRWRRPANLPALLPTRSTSPETRPSISPAEICS